MGCPFDAGSRGHGHQLFERLDKCGTAVGIAGVVNGVDADDDLAGLHHLGPAQRKREKNCVARRNVGRRDVRGVERAVLGNVRWRPSEPSRQTATDRWRAPTWRTTLRALATRARRLELTLMPLPVVDGERKQLKTLRPWRPRRLCRNPDRRSAGRPRADHSTASSYPSRVRRPDVLVRLELQTRRQLRRPASTRPTCAAGAPHEPVKTRRPQPASPALHAKRRPARTRSRLDP